MGGVRPDVRRPVIGSRDRRSRFIGRDAVTVIVAKLSEWKKAYRNATAQWSHERLTTYHEAGHAVAAVTLGIGLVSVSIVPDEARDSCGIGHCRTDGLWAVRRFRMEARIALAKCDADPPALDEYVWSGARNRAEKYWMLALAGCFAEAEHARRRDAVFPSDDDFAVVEDLAHWITFDPEERHDIAVRLGTTTHKLVNSHWPEIVAVAKALLQHTIQSGQQVRQIMATAAQRGGGCRWSP